MFYLRDDNGTIKALLTDEVVQDLFVGAAGTFCNRTLKSGEVVLVYKITTDGITVFMNGCTFFIHEGDYLRKAD